MRFARPSLRVLVAALLVAIAVVPSTASARTARVNLGEMAIVRELNNVRAAHGLPSLRINFALATAADRHSASMLRNGSFSHGEFKARLRRYTKSRSIGETLAWLPRCDAPKMVRMWLESPSHRRILLKRKFRRVGVGRKISQSRCMVTADFASAR